MAKLIEGKVAQILSDKVLIINAGTAAGVRAGMRLVVLAQGEEVKDPTTGEALGRWEVPKGFLRVSHVQERMATCEAAPAPGTRQEESGGGVLSAAMIEASMRPESWGGGSDALNVNRQQVTGLPRIAPISVGDVVREVAMKEENG